MNMQTDSQSSKRVTIDDLARMIAKGFKEVDTQIIGINSQITGIRNEMATKKDIVDIRAEMATKKDIADIRSEMATKRDIERLEQNILKNHGLRIRRIEEKLEMA